MEKNVDVRLSAEEAELIDFALDLVVDAYGKNLDQGGIVDQLKEKYRGTEARALIDQLRRRCYIATDLDWASRPQNTTKNYFSLPIRVNYNYKIKVQKLILKRKLSLSRTII